MREIIDERGQFCLDLDDKTDDKPIVEHPDEVSPPVYTDKKGREVRTCPYCKRILHGGAPCEK